VFDDALLQVTARKASIAAAPFGLVEREIGIADQHRVVERRLRFGRDANADRDISVA
jgi:hypothetical protein